MSALEICFMPATEMVQRIRTKHLSALEVMEAHLAQIDRVNPKVNAIVTRVPTDRLLAQARVAAADFRHRRPGRLRERPRPVRQA